MSTILTQLNNNVLQSCCAFKYLGCVYHQNTSIISLHVIFFD